MFRYFVFVVLILSGLVGWYGFIKYGIDSPLVWALEGAYAPFFWFAIFGAIIFGLWGLLKPNAWEVDDKDSLMKRLIER